MSRKHPTSKTASETINDLPPEVVEGATLQSADEGHGEWTPEMQAAQDAENDERMLATVKMVVANAKSDLGPFLRRKERLDVLVHLATDGTSPAEMVKRAKDVIAALDIWCAEDKLADAD